MLLRATTVLQDVDDKDDQPVAVRDRASEKRFTSTGILDGFVTSFM
jgi:hypothetical protein